MVAVEQLADMHDGYQQLYFICAQQGNIDRLQLLMDRHMNDAHSGDARASFCGYVFDRWGTGSSFLYAANEPLNAAAALHQCQRHTNFGTTIALPTCRLTTGRLFRAGFWTADMLPRF